MTAGSQRWALALMLSALAAGAQAEVRHATFRSASLGQDVAVAVQLPPSYAAGGRDYPALYVLHGLFESADFWERRGLSSILDRMWSRGELAEFVVVAVDGGNSFFLNGPRGRYEDLVTRDTISYAETTYRLKRGREARALLGVSMGGYAALRIAFSQPELFGAVAAHSAMLLQRPPTRKEGAGRWHMDAFHAVFGDPIDTALWNAADPLALASKVAAGGATALSFDCGVGDRYGLFEGNRRLHEILQSRGVAHEFALPPGDHGYDYVREVLPKSLAFVARQWR